MLIWAAWAKILLPDSLLSSISITLASVGVWSKSATVISAVLVIAGEGLVAGALILGSRRTLTRTITAALFICFAAFHVYFHSLGANRGCGCFGGAGQDQSILWPLARNILISLVMLYGAFLLRAR